MRTLHIIGTLDPASGGPAAVVSNFVEFSSLGRVSEVVTLDDPNAAFLAHLKFTVAALGPTSTKYGFNSRLVPWLKANGDRFDAVIVHGLWQYCGLATLRAFASRKPYMVFVHGMLDPYFKRTFPFKHLKKCIYWALVEFWVLRRASRVLFTCTAEEQLARQSFSPQRWHSHVVSFGARLPAGRLADHGRDFLALFPQLEERRFLLFLGRIDRKKGCDLLIQAFIELAGLDPELDLVMAGPDETNWRPELEQRLLQAGLSHRVFWTGMIQGEEKWGALVCAEAFILPSHQENFGIAVAEAMACGTPVLLSDKVNIAPEILHAGGGLMEPDSLAGTRNLLHRWMRMSRAERKTMGDNARSCFALHYDMRTNMRMIDDLLDHTVSSQYDRPLVTVSSGK